jgi:hypothetical protein
LALRTDSSVLSRTRGQLLRRTNPRVLTGGGRHLLQTQLRSAATDLSLSSQDLQRSTHSV